MDKMGRVDIMELLKVDSAKCNVTEKNKPNLKLMANAFISLRKESIK